MNCIELDSLLNPYLDGELVVGEKVRIEGHLAVCPVCAKRAELQRHNHTLVQQLAREGSPKAPEAFKARLLNGLRAEQTRQVHGRWLRVSAAAAGITVAVFVAHHQYRTLQARLYVEDAARRHARQLPLEIEQRSPEQLQAWFGGKLDYAVNIPRFPNATAAGARLMHVRDKEAAYIRYDTHRTAGDVRQVGLFVYGDKGNDVEVPADQPELGNSLGYNVVSWRNGDVVYQLVTDLGEDEVRALLPPGSAVANDPGDQRPIAPPRPSLDVRPASLQR